MDFYYWKPKSNPNSNKGCRLGRGGLELKLHQVPTTDSSQVKFLQFWQLLTIFDNWRQFLQFGQLLLPFWQLKRLSWRLVVIGTLIIILTTRTWIHDNLCYLKINCDTGQHSHFLRCFYTLRKKLYFKLKLPVSIFVCTHLCCWMWIHVLKWKVTKTYQSNKYYKAENTQDL